MCIIAVTVATSSLAVIGKAVAPARNGHVKNLLSDLQRGLSDDIMRTTVSKETGVTPFARRSLPTKSQSEHHKPTNPLLRMGYADEQHARRKFATTWRSAKHEDTSNNASLNSNERPPGVHERRPGGKATASARAIEGQPGGRGRRSKKGKTVEDFKGCQHLLCWHTQDQDVLCTRTKGAENFEEQFTSTRPT